MKLITYKFFFCPIPLLIVAVCLCICHICAGQSPLPDSSKQPDKFSLLQDIPKLKLNDTSFLKDSGQGFSLSKFITRGNEAFSKEKRAIAIPIILKKLFFNINDGYLSYSYYYRSGLDTPYTDKALSEHFVNANLHATVAGAFPITFFFFERETNSEIFRSYRDVRVDFDCQRFRQLRQMRQLEALQQYASSISDPTTKYALQSVEEKKKAYSGWMNNASVISELIHSKETLARKEFTDSLEPVKDSLMKTAQNFVDLYNKVQQTNQQYQHLYDSLLEKVNETEADIKKIRSMVSRGSMDPADIQQVANRYGKDDEHVKKLLRVNDGFQTLSVGRSIPNFSNLSLQNVNVNGINTEYTKGNLYLAGAAGLVTYQLRDFLYKKSQLPKQYVVAGRIGYGKKAGNHVIFTYYTGKKQLYGGNLQQPASYVQGMSVEGQYLLSKNTKVTGEIAQSGFPNSYPNVFASKSTFHLNDRSQRAYSFGLTSYLPATKTKLEGYFQHSGLYFQSFTIYPYHSVVNKWYGSLQQAFWNRQINLTMNVRKNDFTNPSVLQRYDANTVFKTLTLSFRKSKWPSVSVGYLPASQYTAVDSIVYENHYQTITGTTSYQYRLGLAKAVTSVIYSQFFNNSKDSGFLYYNSKNIYVNQMFIFEKFTVSLNLSTARNRGYSFQAAEGNLSALFFKKITLGGSVKVNDLNNETVTIGFNTRARFKISKVGDISLYADRSYLPTSNRQLYKYETYNLGITRYFK